MDAGICAYCPQSWISDDTNPLTRSVKQYDLSMMLPKSVMSCHVVDGKGTDKKKELAFSYTCAKFGGLGYENDATKISKEEIAQIAKQIKEYKAQSERFLFADVFRLVNDGVRLIYNVVTEDKELAELTYLQLRDERNPHYLNLKIQGLDEDTIYQVKQNGENIMKYSGSLLKNVGLPIKQLQYKDEFIIFEFISVK